MSDALFVPVAVTRASSAIVDQMRNAILGGRLKQGERLPPERELASQFGVSRVTLRDALRALEATGVVGARLLVELGTVTLACARASDEDLEALRELDARAASELAGGTYTRELSWDFHALLARAAHNGAVEGLTQSFRDSLSMHPVRVREPRQKAFKATVEEHRRILDAVEKRDAPAARREIAGHLLRGTGLAKREADLLGLWDAAPKKRRAG